MSADLNIGILGCGYVGKAAAQSLQHQHCVTASTRRLNRIEELSTYATKVVLLEKSFDSLLEEQDILIVSVAPSQNDSYEQCYLETARAITQSIADYPRIKQIIYTSSTSVYGEHQGAWVDEDTEPKPSNKKTCILLETENTLLSLASETLSICILRLGEIFGPGRELINRFNSLERKIFPGSGENFTNLTPLRDIVQVINYVINNSLGGIYNLCLDEHPPRKLLYEQICKRNNFPVPLWDTQKQTIHVGNKRVLCDKIKLTGYSLPFQGLE